MFYCTASDVTSTAESRVDKWFVADGDLVLPEYIIRFSYLSEVCWIAF